MSPGCRHRGNTAFGSVLSRKPSIHEPMNAGMPLVGVPTTGKVIVLTFAK